MTRGEKRSGVKQDKRDRDGSGRFLKGVSGNPKGRTPGTSNLAALRAMLMPHVPELLMKLVEMARAGDKAAMDMVLARVLPPLKAQDEPVSLAAFDGPLSDQGRTILAAMASGEITPSQAGELLAALGSQARLVEATELEARIRALESKLNAGGAKP
jgi:hypothetical protein